MFHKTFSSIITLAKVHNGVTRHSRAPLLLYKKSKLKNFTVERGTQFFLPALFELFYIKYVLPFTPTKKYSRLHISTGKFKYFDMDSGNFLLLRGKSLSVQIYREKEIWNIFEREMQITQDSSVNGKEERAFDFFSLL